MSFRTIASRLWLVGWFVAWGALAKRPGGTPSGFFSALALLFGASGLVGGLYLFFRGFRLLRRKRWIEDTPVTKISAAALGPVKIVGKASGPYTLLSPLAGVDCYYYRAVARAANNGQDNQEGEERAVESIYTPLFVEDATGRLLVDPRDAELDLPNEYEETICGESMSEGARRFLRRHGLSTVGDTSVTEYCIKPGDPLSVLGALRERKMRHSASHDERNYLSAEAADLQRREQLEAMGAPAGDFPRQAQSLDPGFDLQPRAVLGVGDGDPDFVLSRETPQRMIDNLARSSVLSIWGGPALALFSLGLVLRWLGVW